MTSEDKSSRRAYHAPQREAAAARTRVTILDASRCLFEERGWTATTMRSIAEHAGVSPKTVEALFRTKAAVLQAVVDYAIRGDIDPRPISQREMATRIERAPSAAAMLHLHATHVRRIHERSARIAWVVEQAAADDPAVKALWHRMNRNRAGAVTWMTELLLTKPGRRKGLRRRDIEAAFWITIDWGTYRTLTEQASLTATEYEAWLRRYYRLVLLEA